MKRKPLKNLTETQKAAIEMVMIRLDPEDPRNLASKEVVRDLRDENLPLARYIRDWVHAELRLALYGESYYNEGRDVKRNLAERNAMLKKQGN